ncbi:hypothetical protein BH11BAC4_BH11BAC4_14730 [soil metagenome]
MIGCDFHQELSVPVPPAPPIPVPMPHFVGAILGNLPGAALKTVKRSDDSLGKKPVLVNHGVPIILQGSDIGPVIGHVPLMPFTPSPLTAINTIFSGSTSEFFAFSVKVHGKPVAIAFPEVHFILNLNCGFPCSAPFGSVIAPSTVVTGFRGGDFFASFLGMVSDIAFSWLINAAFNGTSLKGDGGICGLNGLMTNRNICSITRTILQSGIVQSKWFQPIVGAVGLLGSPMGYSNEYTTFLGAFYTDAKSAGTQWVADQFNPPPGGGTIE